jgi:radical SAM superfamily enzyme YgiQ (UPF0313 family)
MQLPRPINTHPARSSHPEPIMVKTLLLCSPSSYELDQHASIPSLMLVSLAAAVEASLPGVKVHIGTGDAETLDRLRPDVVGISCFSASWHRCVVLALECRRRGIGVVVGGPHINARARDVTPDMDIAVRGEGDEVLPRLLRSWSDGWHGTDLADIPGLVHWNNRRDALIETGAPVAIAQLDSLPMMLLPPQYVRDGTLHLISTRGCPFKCTFCATPSHDNIRVHSADYIARYIKRHVERYPHIDRVKFWDDLFALNRRRVRELDEAFARHGLGWLKYQVSVRADQVRPELIERFRRMNVTDLFIGIESGSPETLDYINKRYDLAAVHRAMALLRREPFTLTASFIIGFPHETERHLKETYDLIRQAPLHLSQVFLLAPFPGTVEWQRALARGLVQDSPDFDWALLDEAVSTRNPDGVLGNALVLSAHLDRETLYRWLLRFRRVVRRQRLRHGLRLLRRDPRRFLRNLVYNSPLRGPLARLGAA